MRHQIQNAGVDVELTGAAQPEIIAREHHVLEGEGSMEIEGLRQIVRKHDVIFIPPGIPHSICNNGITDLTFIVVTTPIEDE